MMQALLHAKLGRAEGEADTGQADILDTATLRGLEDAVTSTAFERLSYLDVAVSWEVLSRAVTPLAESPSWPERVPEGSPEWHFWPRLTPSSEGWHTNFVEPDVMLRFPGEGILVFEMKHHGVQYASQWKEELLAARQRWPGGEPLIFIAVGGLNPEVGHTLAKEVGDGWGEAPRPAFYQMTWRRLREAAEGLLASGSATSLKATQVPLTAGARRILQDLVAGLAYFGYVKKVYFETIKGGPALELEHLHAWHVGQPQR